MADKQKLTKAGYKKLQDELKYLVDVAREEIKVQLAEARAQGDLSENADYDAARAKQAEVEGRIKEIENIIANAEIIEEGKASNKKVGLGSTVTIRFVDNNKEASYMIVGTVESDPVNGKISNSCPLGEALTGKSAGDIIEVKATDGARYTFPTSINVDRMEDLLTVRFRVGNVYKNCFVNVYFDDEQVQHLKKRILAPGEMEQFIVQKKQLEGKDVKTITVKIEAE